MEKEKEVKKIEIIYYGCDWHEPPSDEVYSLSAEIALNVGERRLSAAVYFFWDFWRDARLTWDGERVEGYGFDICPNINIFEDGDDIEEYDYKTYGISLLSLDIALYAKNKGKLVKADRESYDYDAAREVASVVDARILNLLQQKGRLFLKEAIVARREILADEDLEDPELEFFKAVIEDFVDKVVSQAFEEIKKREIKLVCADGEYEIL